MAIDCEELQTDMAAILAAWTDLCDKTNDPSATAASIEEAYRVFDDRVMPVMVKQGHPGQPYPRRRPS